MLLLVSLPQLLPCYLTLLSYLRELGKSGSSCCQPQVRLACGIQMVDNRFVNKSRCCVLWFYRTDTVLVPTKDAGLQLMSCGHLRALSSVLSMGAAWQGMGLRDEEHDLSSRARFPQWLAAERPKTFS